MFSARKLPSIHTDVAMTARRLIDRLCAIQWARKNNDDSLYWRQLSTSTLHIFVSRVTRAQTHSVFMVFVRLLAFDTLDIIVTSSRSHANAFTRSLLTLCCTVFCLHRFD